MVAIKNSRHFLGGYKHTALRFGKPFLDLCYLPGVGV
jgi:hypothetical protein